MPRLVPAVFFNDQSQPLKREHIPKTKQAQRQRHENIEMEADAKRLEHVNRRGRRLRFEDAKQHDAQNGETKQQRQKIDGGQAEPGFFPDFICFHGRLIILQA